MSSRLLPASVPAPSRRAAQQLLRSILPLLVGASLVVGCGDKEDDDDDDDDSGERRPTQDSTACLPVEEGADCPEPADVPLDELWGSCGSEVVRVTGAGEYADNIGWGWDSGQAQPGCCYPVRETEPTCVYGRPLKDATGSARLAALVEDAAWAAGLCPAEAPARLRAVLAERWTRAARDEHASVAAFSKVSLDLMRFGAPPELLARTHQAALDEVRHAQLGFAVASAFSGRPVGPGAFPLAELPLAQSLRELAVDAATEGCLGEGLASLLAAEGARRAVDPVLREVLATIAEDEAEHARLAWRTVAWAIEVGGAPVRRAVAAVFEDALQHGILVPEAPEEDLSAWGLLCRAEAEQLGRLCLEQVVAPAARALLGEAAPQPASLA